MRQAHPPEEPIKEWGYLIRKDFRHFKVPEDTVDMCATYQINMKIHHASGPHPLKFVECKRGAAQLIQET